MTNQKLVVVCFAVMMPLAYADQGGFLNSGGSLGGGSPVANPPGTLTISGNNLDVPDDRRQHGGQRDVHHQFDGRKLLRRRQGRSRDLQFHV